MKVEADRRCFVCGPENPLGLNVKFSIDNSLNASRAILAIAEGYQGWQGIVHGGIISALLDEAAIYACRPISMQAVTAALNIRFLKPVMTDVEIEVQAEVLSVKRKLAVVRSRIHQNGELMTEADVKVVLKNSKEGQA